VTTVVSCAAVAARRMSTLTGSAPTVTLCVRGVKPMRWTRRVYVPAGTPGIVNRPSCEVSAPRRVPSSDTCALPTG
jgi:hypothetical protein